METNLKVILVYSHLCLFSLVQASSFTLSSSAKDDLGIYEIDRFEIKNDKSIDWEFMSGGECIFWAGQKSGKIDNDEQFEKVMKLAELVVNERKDIKGQQSELNLREISTSIFVNNKNDKFNAVPINNSSENYRLLKKEISALLKDLKPESQLEMSVDKSSKSWEVTFHYSGDKKLDFYLPENANEAFTANGSEQLEYLKKGMAQRIEFSKDKRELKVLLKPLKSKSSELKYWNSGIIHHQAKGTKEIRLCVRI